MLSYLQRLFAQEFILAVLSEAIVEKEKKNRLFSTSSAGQCIFGETLWKTHCSGQTICFRLFGELRTLHGIVNLKRKGKRKHKGCFLLKKILF